MEYIELLYKIRNYLYSFGIIMYFVEIKKFDICLQNVNDEERFSSPKFSFLNSDNKNIYILDKPDYRIKYMYGSLNRKVALKQQCSAIYFFLLEFGSIYLVEVRRLVKFRKTWSGPFA